MPTKGGVAHSRNPRAEGDNGEQGRNPLVEEKMAFLPFSLLAREWHSGENPEKVSAGSVTVPHCPPDKPVISFWEAVAGVVVSVWQEQQSSSRSVAADLVRVVFYGSLSSSPLVFAPLHFFFLGGGGGGVGFAGTVGDSCKGLTSVDFSNVFSRSLIFCSSCPLLLFRWRWRRFDGDTRRILQISLFRQVRH